MYATAEQPRTDSYRFQAEHTISIFERSAIAIFPSGRRRKGSYVEDWPNMAADEASAITRRDLAHKAVNLAGRTGNGVAVFDFDAKNDVDPVEMLQVLVHVRRRDDGECVGCIEVGLYEIVRALVLAETREAIAAGDRLREKRGA